MKSGRPHQVALSPFAAWPLAVQKAHDVKDGKRGRFVFSDTDQAPDRLNRILRTLRQATCNNDWSWHDLRRAFLTWAVRNGHPREHAQIALGHMTKDTLARSYDQHAYHEEAAAVMLAWQQHIESLVTSAA
jgi:integrase